MTTIRFGTDGWRAAIAEDFTFHNVRRCARGVADHLLEQGTAEGGDDFGRFLLLAATLGARAAGEHAEARRIWSAYGTALYRGSTIPPHVNYVVDLN